MINKLLFKITGYLPCRLINHGNKRYLERYYILPFVYLHRFTGVDGDRNVHDRPWLFAFSFVLNGSYVEEILINSKVYYHPIIWSNY